MRPARTVILDAYNVILRSPAFRPDERRDLAAAREKLVNLLSWTVGAGEVEFVLVFDGANVPGGARGATGSNRVQIRFSKPPEKADDLIRRLVEEWAEVRDGLTVVTSDLEVAAHARAQGASIVLSDVFAASLFADRTEERLKDLVREKGTRAGGTGSPTAAGSDAEDKPQSISKRERDEWLRMFEKQGGAEGLAPEMDPEGGN
jgi:predicted RNA-binding protein with PIN domain